MGGHVRGLLPPFSYYREGLENVSRNVTWILATRNGGLPIASYNEMSVGELSYRLDGLSVEELTQLRDHEKRHKNRNTLIEQTSRKIKTSS